jgi:PAS domain S-box-containing protein
MEMLGFTREEYIGHNIAEFHADQPVIEEMLERLTKGETLSNCEARLNCRDGSIRNVLINSNVLWEGGKFVHTRCFTRDITARKEGGGAGEGA